MTVQRHLQPRKLLKRLQACLAENENENENEKKCVKECMTT